MASSSSSTTDDKPNTLSNVVSNLVRASMGTSLSSTVTDEDLDRHVAELILREAKKKAEKYSQHGIRAYIASNLQDSNAPRTNKRFLTSIIRSTDDHNKAILKAQAEAAEEVKRVRREQEKRERRARAEEAVRARTSGGRHRSSRSSHPYSSSRRSWREEREGSFEDGWDRWNGRTADREKERQKRKVRSWETWDGEKESEDGEERRRKKRKDRERGKDRERSWSRDRDVGDKDRRWRRRKEDVAYDDGDYRRRRRYRSRSASPRCQQDREGARHRHRGSVSTGHSCSPRRTSDKESKYALDDLREDGGLGDNYVYFRRAPPTSRMQDDGAGIDTSSTRSPSERPRRDRSRSASSSRLSPKSKPSSRSSSRTRSMSLSSRSPSPTPGPFPLPDLPSKMDKYFEESYDPRLDVAPLSTVPNVPATGLINDAEFEGWDAMLELIKLRRQDKEDRKRLERLGLTDKKDKKGKGKDKAKVGAVGSSIVVSGTASNIMGIEYKKRGSVREWDLGKEDLSF